MADLSTVEGLHESLADVQLVDCREQYEWDAGRIEGALHILGRCVSGDRNRGNPAELCVERSDPANHLIPIFGGHPQVGHDDIWQDVGGRCAQYGKCLGAGGNSDDDGPTLFQHRLRQISRVGLIVDEQHSRMRQRWQLLSL